MTPLLRDLKEDRLQTLQIDRRSLWGNSKFSTTSSLDTLETYDSDTDDESFSSSSEVSDQEEKAFWWSMLLSRIISASKVESVILHDEVLVSTDLIDEPHTQPSFFEGLLRSLTSLPKLRILRMYISRRNSLDFALLKEVVQACSGLEQLIICDSSNWEDDPSENAFALTSPKQVDMLAGTIRNHPSLIEVSLQECFVAAHLSLDPIVEACATLPRLEMINLTLTQGSVRRISDSSLVRLFRVETLQDVTLWSMGLDDGHLRCLRDILPTHPSLVFLSLRCNSKITQVGWQTLCDIVEENYVLRSVYTDEIVSPERENMLQNYLYWNQLGRGNLLQSNDPAQWLESIERWQHDPTSLLYLARHGHSCLLSRSS